MGAAGLVLFYVGVFVPKIDDALIAVADEISLPLIAMPFGRPYALYFAADGSVSGTKGRGGMAGFQPMGLPGAFADAAKAEDSIKGTADNGIGRPQFQTVGYTRSVKDPSRDAPASAGRV